MLSGPFALALTAGMAATVNPCGFALLPAYLSAFVGLDAGTDGNRALAILKALKVSVVLTAGFITVFSVFGIVITKIFDGIQTYLPWATIVIGIGLLALGVHLLLGRQITVHIPKLDRGGADGTLASMYLFGVSYAVASLSCTLPSFLIVTTQTFGRGSYVSGVMAFVLYGFGMGIVVGVLTIAVALAKNGIVAKFRSLLPKMNRVAGGLLLIAGAYVAYYGWYEIRLQDPAFGVDDPIIDGAESVQGWLLGFVPSTHDAPWFGLAGAVLFAAVALWAFRRRGDGSEPEPVETSPEVAEV